MGFGNRNGCSTKRSRYGTCCGREKLKADSRLSEDWIGIFGGSFDPPHLAHAEILKSIARQMPFKKIWIVPSKFPPGKTPVADYESRLRWTQKTLGNLEKVEISDLEASSSHSIFAKDIFYQLQLHQPDCPHFWILGEDQWEQLPYWREVDDYGDQLGWIVFSRSERQREQKQGLMSRRLLQKTCAYRWAEIQSYSEASSTGLRDSCSRVSFQSSETPLEWNWLADDVREEICNYYFKKQKEKESR